MNYNNIYVNRNLWQINVYDEYNPANQNKF